jgi:two-component system nitrogen regulation response regulator NtrX
MTDDPAPSSDSSPLPGEPILIVDDEKNIRRTLRMVLEGEGHVVHEAGSIAEAEAVLGREPIDLLLLDVKLGDDNGLDLLRTLKSRGEDGMSSRTSEIPVVMISGHATIDDAVAATRLGAFDFMEKPLDRHRVVVTARNALERRKMWKEVHDLRRAVDARFELLGSTPIMLDLRRQIAKVAPTRSRVLITGDSGTGKELIARAIHRNSAVSTGTFVKVNCAAIPPELIESELFGHERGAFTGAIAKKRGLFEVADGGTIFLDEIGDMAHPAQAKVLRVLQTGEFTRVGGEKSLRTDCRVVAATNRDLEQMVKDGQFREDLFFRLNVVPIHVPPLRERRDDIPMLARHFARLAAVEQRLPPRDFSDDALERLARLDWQGNVRELRNTVERLLILARGETIGGSEVARLVAGAVSDGGASADLIGAITFAEFKDRAERAFILAKLREHDWNVSETARVIEMPRSNLYKKIERYQLTREEA